MFFQEFLNPTITNALGRPLFRLGNLLLRSRTAAGCLLAIGMGMTLSPAATDTVDIPMITVAGKSEQVQANTSVTSTVVKAREMRRTGAATLSDVLAEQTGLMLVQDHGTGVQMQGLSPDYTLILIDGEPAVGRTAGTLELDRFLVGGLDQIEIVKGPSSSLYGSDALGGVVNLITRRPSKPFAASFNSRYGTNRTFQTGLNLELRQGPTALSLFADRSASEGYDLTPASRSQTAPAYQAYALQPKLVYAYADDSRLTISGRWFREHQRNTAMFQTGPDSVPARERALQADVGLTAALEHELSPEVNLTVKAYTTRFQTEMGLRLDSTGLPQNDSLVSLALFDQQYHKAEAYTVARHHEGFTLTGGGGGSWETVRADRVEGGMRGAYSGFLFAQEEFSTGSSLNIQASGRLDVHRDYAATFNPRVAAMVRPISRLTLRTSVGRGFKAPSFQQLYMDFTNPTVGYSVYGSHGVREAVDRLDEQGQIAERLQVLEDFELRPEHSWSFNAGAEWTEGPLSLRSNAFYNSVRDLIESRAVARKTNGQGVHTYFNLNRIHTWGLENDVAYQLLKSVRLEAGYQFLVARDENVMGDIRAGEIFKEGSTGVVRPVQLVEYGGLFNRSRHSGNVKATWEGGVGKTDVTASLRGVMRGRYGYADRNGNGILDADNEYEPGYTLWNLSLSASPMRSVAFEVRIDNLFDVVRPLVPLPGRLMYAGVRIHTF